MRWGGVSPCAGSCEDGVKTSGSFHCIGVILEKLFNSSSLINVRKASVWIVFKGLRYPYGTLRMIDSTSPVLMMELFIKIHIFCYSLARRITISLRSFER